MKSTLMNVEELIGADYENFQQMFGSIELFLSHSAANREQLGNYVDEQESPEAEQSIKLSVAAYLLGRFDQAVQILKSAPEGKDKRWLLALTYKNQGEYSKSLADLERAKTRGWDETESLAKSVEIHRVSGDLKAAHSALNQLQKIAGDSVYYYYQLGELTATEGDEETAIDYLQQAVEKDPSYLPALFRMAFLLDLNGEEEQAINLYRQCVKINPAHVNALMNLAVLYEDNGRYELAKQLLERILEVYPNHPRANMFLKDVDSSLSMFFDEEYERKRDKFQQVLDMPISDFELSVRSRNCLKKMGIKTLGDLTRITESELLSYKNFGETSLTEIKVIMTSKGLRLGQAVEDKASKKAASMLPGYDSSEESEADQALFEKSIDDLQLSVRSKKCLQKLNISTVGDIMDYTEQQLMAVKNFGSISLKEVKEKLAEIGLELPQSDS